MGLVCASVYVLSLILFIPFAFSTPIRAHANGYGKREQQGLTIVEFPHYQVSSPEFRLLSSSLTAISSCLSTFPAFCPF